MSTYRADVTREDGWWMIRIPELDLTTQAETWAEVERMARGVIAADQDVDLSTVTVALDVRPSPEAIALMQDCRAAAAEAERLRRESVRAAQQAARLMHSEGWSYRLIGKAMNLSHQRAEQLVKGTR